VRFVMHQSRREILRLLGLTVLGCTTTRVAIHGG